MTMDELPYVLLDRRTANFLGEWKTYEEAEQVYLEYVQEDLAAIQRLEIWFEDERVYVDPEKLRPFTAA